MYLGYMKLYTYINTTILDGKGNYGKLARALLWPPFIHPRREMTSLRHDAMMEGLDLAFWYHVFAPFGFDTCNLYT